MLHIKRKNTRPGNHPAGCFCFDSSWSKKRMSYIWYPMILFGWNHNAGSCGGLCFCCWHGRRRQCHHSHLPCTPRWWVRVGLPGERSHSWRLGGQFGHEVGPGCLKLCYNPQRGCGLQCRSYWPRVGHGRDRSWSFLGRSYMCPHTAVIDHHQDSGTGENSVAILGNGDAFFMQQVSPNGANILVSSAFKS